jgi:hypothetical protein
MCFLLLISVKRKSYFHLSYVLSSRRSERIYTLHFDCPGSQILTSRVPHINREIDKRSWGSVRQLTEILNIRNITRGYVSHIIGYLYLFSSENRYKVPPKTIYPYPSTRMLWCSCCWYESIMRVWFGLSIFWIILAVRVRSFLWERLRYGLQVAV